MVLSLVFMFQLRFSHDTLAWFPERMDIHKDITLIDRVLKGSITLEVIVEGREENSVKDPAILQGIDRAAADLSEYENGDLFVGKVISVNDVLKEVHRALNGDDPAYYRVPDDRDMIAQEFLLSTSSTHHHHQPVSQVVLRQRVPFLFR